MDVGHASSHLSSWDLMYILSNSVAAYLVYAGSAALSVHP